MTVEFVKLGFLIESKFGDLHKLSGSEFDPRESWQDLQDPGPNQRGLNKSIDLRKNRVLYKVRIKLDSVWTPYKLMYICRSKVYVRELACMWCRFTDMYKKGAIRGSL